MVAAIRQRRPRFHIRYGHVGDGSGDGAARIALLEVGSRGRLGRGFPQLSGRGWDGGRRGRGLGSRSGTLSVRRRGDDGAEREDAESKKILSQSCLHLADSMALGPPVSSDSRVALPATAVNPLRADFPAGIFQNAVLLKAAGST